MKRPRRIEYATLTNILLLSFDLCYVFGYFYLFNKLLVTITDKCTYTKAKNT